MTVTWFVDDPVYLSDTYIKSVDFIVAPRGVSTAQIGTEAVDNNGGIFTQCLNRAEIARSNQSYVPHYLPGENPFIGERAEEIGVPVEATFGGAETAYPEYKELLKE